MNQSPPDSSSSSSTSAPPSLIDAPSSGEAAEGNAEYESAGGKWPPKNSIVILEKMFFMIQKIEENPIFDL